MRSIVVDHARDAARAALRSTAGAMDYAARSRPSIATVAMSAGEIAVHGADRIVGRQRGQGHLILDAAMQYLAGEACVHPSPLRPEALRGDASDWLILPGPCIEAGDHQRPHAR
ncbi:hypothetical protein WR25_13757 [Diploscapter pachys]|uniref:Uncharacterized protein n=1 Tax=Diploscapter pachys TaxID=2018661 RepID=A0A2A2K4I7_9BILA|nr:hypothetical protein WR25_13757 [Diploscapter pachys]